MRILAIDTSCDETAAAVTENETILSNIIWSQASLHAKFGGVVPSLAQRQHEGRIDFVIQKALRHAFPNNLVPNAYTLIPKNIDAVAVTIGPGLAIALGVGINKAKEISNKYKLPLIPINHVEAHLLSPLAKANTKLQFLNSKQNARFPTSLKLRRTSKIQNLKFPSYGLVVSGGNTLFILVKNIGDYEILAQTVDDALGEALDKGARMLDFGYPGGAVLEKFAKEGNPNSYPLPIPMIGQEKKMIFSYSGLKTAMWRLVEKEKQTGLNKAKIANLAASYQNVAFEHLIRVMDYYFRNSKLEIRSLLIGGGVAANVELRKRLRRLEKKHNIKVHFPYSKKLYGDNAAMVGVCAYLKTQGSEVKIQNLEEIDRKPDLKLVSRPG